MKYLLLCCLLCGTCSASDCKTCMKPPPVVVKNLNVYYVDPYYMETLRLRWKNQHPNKVFGPFEQIKTGKLSQYYIVPAKQYAKLIQLPKIKYVE